MRRILLPVALVLLSGTLIAQAGSPVLGQVSKLVVNSSQKDGDRFRWTGVRFEFPNGVVLTADEAVGDNKGGPIDLSGNVRITAVPRSIK